MSWPLWAKCVCCWKDDLNFDPISHYGNKEFIPFPCLHVICATGGCFEKVFDNQEDSGVAMERNKGERPLRCQFCPVCSRIIPATVKSFLFRPLDFVAMETEKPGQLCTTCLLKGRAVSRCAECDLYFCEECNENHTFGVDTNSHVVLDLTQMVAKIPDPEPICGIHSGILDRYCKTCDRRVCAGCLGSHGKCEILSAEEGFDFMAKNVKGIMSRMGKLVPELKKLQLDVQTKSNCILTTEKDDLVKGAESMLTDMFDKLYSREQQLRSDIRNKYEESARVLRLKQTQCRRQMLSVSQYGQFISSLVTAAMDHKDGGTSEAFLGAYRLAKSRFPEQVNTISKCRLDSLDLGTFFRVDKGPSMLLDNEIPSFCKLRMHMPNTKIQRTTTKPHLQIPQQLDSMAMATNISMAKTSGQPNLLKHDMPASTIAPTRPTTPIMINVQSRTGTQSPEQRQPKIRHHHKQKNYAAKRTGGGFCPRNPMPLAMDQDCPKNPKPQHKDPLGMDEDCRKNPKPPRNDPLVIDEDCRKNPKPPRRDQLAMGEDCPKNPKPPRKDPLVMDEDCRKNPKPPRKDPFALDEDCPKNPMPRRKDPLVMDEDCPKNPMLPLKDPLAMDNDCPKNPKPPRKDPLAMDEDCNISGQDEKNDAQDCVEIPVADRLVKKLGKTKSEKTISKILSHPLQIYGSGPDFVSQSINGCQETLASKMNRKKTSLDPLTTIVSTTTPAPPATDPSIPIIIAAQNPAVTLPQRQEQPNVRHRRKSRNYAVKRTGGGFCPKSLMPPPNDHIAIDENDRISFQDEETDTETLVNISPVVDRHVKKSQKAVSKAHAEPEPSRINIYARLPGKRQIKQKTYGPDFVSSRQSFNRYWKKPADVPKIKSKRGRKKALLDPSNTTDDSDHDDFCLICRDGGDDLLCCESCTRIFHAICHIPALSGIPNGPFSCNLCKSKADACDPTKQSEKHIRSKTSTGIHRNRVEFYKACKFLSEIFGWENEFEMRLLVDVIRGELSDFSESQLFVVRRRLTNNEPHPFSDAKEMLVALEDVFQSFADVLKRRPSSTKMELLENFDITFNELLREYYPEYKRKTLNF